MHRHLERLAELGAGFVLLRAGSKRPLERGWPERPRSVACAMAHLARGGNVGLLAGYGGWVALDLDADFDRFRARFADELVGFPQVGRAGVPGRGKVLLRVAGQMRNRVWRPREVATPAVELLAQRRVAALLPSRHPAGEPYGWLTAGWEAPGMEIAALATWWQAWTGDAWLAAVPRTPSTHRAAVNGAETSTAVARAKQCWPRAVFQHWGRAERVTREGQQWRLRHQGGLLVGDPASDTAWRWYCHAEGVGGDQIDAWGWCRFGGYWDRYDGALFRTVLVEMITM